ncbi:MAG TPA: serine/threonine-protein kinase [Pseudonocardiaceae bacterium]
MTEQPPTDAAAGAPAETEAAVTEQPTLTSQRLIAGRYRLRRVLGRGSMGVVWLAYDEVLHRQVAVKEVQLPAGMPDAEASDARERTLREARAIAALTHPNVVAVYDVAKEGVEPFVVMEWLRGRSLAQLTGRAGPLNTEQAAVVADAIAAGLDLAHRRGITHRDIKPGNVLVGEDGQVKLTDFGISRNVSEVTMTSSGLVLGTPAYMAPEVAAGGELTTAADLWSLGATLFAAVTGRPPYDAGDALATVNEVVHGPIPAVPDDVPLAEVITGLMARDPAERLSVMEVRRRIRPLLPEPGSIVFPPDEAEETAGPADNKPTTNLAVPRRDPPAEASPRLAAEPGPLPWAAPPPVPVAVRPRPAGRRGPVVSALLFVVAVALFAAAAGGGFVATRTLAGRSVLPSLSPATATTTTVPPTPPVRTFVTVTAVAAPPAGTGGGFSLRVPQGWARFVEQRAPGPQLPASTVVRWVQPDGMAEVSVERFRDFLPQPLHIYTDTLQRADPQGSLFRDKSGAPEYQFRSGGTTQRTTYLSLVTVPGDDDLWVVSVTVPTDQEQSGESELFERISPSFRVAG